MTTNDYHIVFLKLLKNRNQDVSPTNLGTLKGSQSYRKQEVTPKESDVDLDMITPLSTTQGRSESYPRRYDLSGWPISLSTSKLGVP